MVQLNCYSVILLFLLCTLYASFHIVVLPFFGMYLHQLQEHNAFSVLLGKLHYFQ